MLIMEDWAIDKQFLDKLNVCESFGSEVFQ